MSVRLTITQIGTPKEIQTSRGTAQKNYIKAQEYGNEFLNYFLNNSNRGWAVGQVVEVESVEKRDYTAKDGSLKTSYDIKFPKFGGNSKQMEEVLNTLAKHGVTLQRLLNGVAEIHKAVVQPKADVIDGTDIPYPKHEGTPNFNVGDERAVPPDAELNSLDELAKGM